LISLYLFQFLTLFCIYLDPDGPPEDVSVTKINITSYQVTWKPVRNDLRNGIITKYQVLLTLVKQGTTDYNNQTIVYVSSQTPLEYVFRGLRPSARYTVAVKGFTQIGAGPYSISIGIVTGSAFSPLCFYLLFYFIAIF